MSHYIKEKLKVFEELHINLSEEQKKHIESLKSEVAIDNYIRPIIINGYDKFGY